MKYITIFILTLLSLSSCIKKNNNIDPYKLCEDFYKLNKDNTFNNLFNVQILGIREYSKYIADKNKYKRIPSVIIVYDSIFSDANVVLPSYPCGTSLDTMNMYFMRCDSFCINYLKNKYELVSIDTLSLLNSYIKEIDGIYSKYYQIKVPQILPYMNVELRGCGNYIEFILYKDEDKKIRYSCYYVRDTVFSSDNLRNYFKTLPQFDEHWYYKTIP